MGYEYKFGDWCEGLKDGKRYRFLVRCAYNRDNGRFLDGEGVFSSIAYADLKPLPDCTGWDWKPTLQLREGAWYERADGKIVGPCRPCSWSKERWVVDQYWYNDDGTNTYDLSFLIREVDPPKKPKYRPFKNADEFKPHRDRWLVNKASGTMKRVCEFNDTGIWFAFCSESYQQIFEHYTFGDGTPFGMLDE